MFIAHHRLDRSPGQRYRFEQVFDYLESKGLECVLANIIAEEDEYSLYQSNNIIKKLWIGIKSYKKRSGFPSLDEVKAKLFPSGEKAGAPVIPPLIGI